MPFNRTFLSPLCEGHLPPLYNQCVYGHAIYNRVEESYYINEDLSDLENGNFIYMIRLTL